MVKSILKPWLICLNDAISFANRGFAYRHLGKEEKAIKDFKKAQALDPSAIVNEQIKLIEEELSEKVA
jgi:tetratricopeptide (TPR) repeat protein